MEDLSLITRMVSGLDATRLDAIEAIITEDDTPLIVRDLTGQYMLCNEAYRDFWNRREVPETINDIFTPEDWVDGLAQAWAKLMRQYIQSGGQMIARGATGCGRHRTARVTFERCGEVAILGFQPVHSDRPGVTPPGPGPAIHPFAPSSHRIEPQPPQPGPAATLLHWRPARH